MSVNVDALRRVLEYVTEHPEKHDQSAWAKRTECGTTACLAGHLVLMEGHEIAWWRDESVAWEVANGGEIADVAAEILEIERYDPDGWDDEDWDEERWGEWRDPDGGDPEYRHLFSPRNTLADLWHIAARLTDGAIEVPEQFRSVA